jgi:tripartite-type tricarboxylate transporter receptor subunit TctC
MNDLIPGRVHLLFSGGATLDNARSGQVQVLGYTGARRAAIAPEVPTIAEDGVPGFGVVSWYGFFVPAKTPAEIIAKMNADTIAALADPSVKGRLAPLGYESSPDPPEKVGAFLRSEAELWTRVIKQPASLHWTDGLVNQNVSSCRSRSCRARHAAPAQA